MDLCRDLMTVNYVHNGFEQRSATAQFNAMRAMARSSMSVGSLSWPLDAIERMVFP